MGGVEFGFMSATGDRSVAVRYSSGTNVQGLILEIDQGMLDRGASLQRLSQYPHEAETCFPPCTGLELMRMASGEADTEQVGKVKIVKMRAQPKAPNGAKPPRPQPATVTFKGCRGATLEEAWRKAQEQAKVEAVAREQKEREKAAQHQKDMENEGKRASALLPSETLAEARAEVAELKALQAKDRAVAEKAAKPSAAKAAEEARLAAELEAAA